MRKPPFTGIDFNLQLEVPTSIIDSSCESAAEALLDALIHHRSDLYDEMEAIREKWATSEAITLDKIKESCAHGDLFYCMGKIKLLDSFIIQIGVHSADHLRRIAQSLPD